MPLPPEALLDQAFRHVIGATLSDIPCDQVSGVRLGRIGRCGATNRVHSTLQGNQRVQPFRSRLCMNALGEMDASIGLASVRPSTAHAPTTSNLVRAWTGRRSHVPFRRDHTGQVWQDCRGPSRL